MSDPDRQHTASAERDEDRSPGRVGTLVARLLEQDFAESDPIRGDWIRMEIASRLRAYKKWSRIWRAIQMVTWAAGVILGLLIAVFANLKTGHTFTIIAGALVATLTTVTNAVHPGRQADAYQAGRWGIRDESWCLLNKAGDYATIGDAAERYAKFQEKIHDIVLVKREATTLAGFGGG